MLTLQKASRRGGAGRTIPTPYDGFAKYDFELQAGQVSMFAAAAGVGKSAVALDIVMKSRRRCMYICGDTDAWTMVVRATAKVTGYPQAQVKSMLAAEHPDFTNALADYPDLRFVFDATSTLDIHDEVLAYAIMYGDWPEIIVVDNLADIVESEGGEFAGVRQALQELGILARNTGAHVMTLHHVVGKYEDGNVPIPQSGLENKVSKKPAQIVTLNRQGSMLRACIVKNRQGEADAQANLWIPLMADMATMNIRDWPEGLGYGY
jgi:predicted ATP-dependent serine protease